MSVREEAIVVMSRASAEGGTGQYPSFGRALDALLADPARLVALLCEIEVPCETCGGTGNDTETGILTDEGMPLICVHCDGRRSRPLGREGVLRLLGGEQAGWESISDVCHRADGMLSLAAYRGIDDEWKVDALALSWRFRGLAKQLAGSVWVFPEESLTEEDKK